MQRAFGDLTAGDVAEAADLEDLAHDCLTVRNVTVDRLQHALQRLLDVLDQVVDDAVLPDLDVLLLSKLFGAGIRLRVEADDNALGSNREHDVRLGDVAGGGVDNL